MVKICQMGLLKLNFETRPKKRIFRFLPKISACQFPNPWALRVSGMGGYSSKCAKSQNHCTLLDNHAPTFKNYATKYYLDEKSIDFLHNLVTFCPNARKLR
jgi:hypothetical protein